MVGTAAGGPGNDPGKAWAGTESVLHREGPAQGSHSISGAGHTGIRVSHTVARRAGAVQLNPVPWSSRCPEDTLGLHKGSLEPEEALESQQWGQGGMLGRLPGVGDF